MNEFEGKSVEEPYDEKSSLRASFPDENEASQKFSFKSFLKNIPKRYILTFMAFLGFANLYAQRVNMSVAIVAMTNNFTIKKDNFTIYAPAYFNYDKTIQGTILSSFFYGYIFTQLPGGFAAKFIGGKVMFGGFTLLSSFLTLVTPFCAYWNVSVLIIIRVLTGLAEGAAFPSVHALWSVWAPPHEKTALANFAFAGSFLGTVICLPVSWALAASKAGWPSIFYVIGSVGLLWVAAWWYIISESPSVHPTIDPVERDLIKLSIGTKSEVVQIPWKSILTSLPVWAMVAAHFAENWGFYTFLTLLPTYMNDVLHFQSSSSGLLAMLPYLAMGITLIFASRLADYICHEQFFTVTTVRKMFLCGAMCGQLIFMLATGYVNGPAAALSCLVISVALGGFAWAGFGANNLDLAPQYASIIMGLSNTFATIPGIISPTVMDSIVVDKTLSEWRIVFFITCGIYVIGILVFGIFASGEKQDWSNSSSPNYTTYQEYENNALDEG